MPVPNAQTGNMQASDAPPGNWVDRFAPLAMQPYLRLMRADRPIGTWLLLWPCWWSAALAWVAAGTTRPDLWLLLLFAIGATVMRGAGCIYNDIADRDFDAQVARTRTRPIPSGQVSVFAAAVFMVALSFTGLAVLLQFNAFAIVIGIGSLGIVALYPFMKRITYWPQIVLGLAFSWGALMGWAAVFGRIDAPALFLYAAAIVWTIGYDTIYAHQDKDDDALLGLKSTALKFGPKTKPWLTLFYGATIVLLGIAGIGAGAHWPFFAGLALASLHLVWQTATLDVDDPANCLKRFRSNRDFGALVFLALLADMAL
ncbi:MULTISPECIES: 4-hydroxybenzoate octaprenyltransferase [Rhodomicrobium]|uniref:4-hydroxybenzoate octaprenyltransferase n=1 Tax=Rhodomicrobium TaxID=1068 RepID=UPI000B4BA2D1|nr:MULTISPECIES: 4-hydroxybenzoate octaprenyltransferase [Rhodomicrobium]